MANNVKSLSNLWRQRQLGGSDNKMSTVKRRQRSTFLSFVYLLKGFLGMGFYTLPYATRYGPVQLFINMVIFALCVYLLVNVCQQLGGGLTYPETVEAACLTCHKLQKFAQSSCIIVHIFLFCSTIFLCSLYIVFITHHTCLVATGTKGVPVDPQMWLLLLSIPLLVLCLLPWLTIMAVIGVLCQLVTILLFFGYIVPMDISSINGLNRDMFKQDAEHFVKSSLATSFLEGIAIVLVVENEMKYPNKLIGCPSLLCTVMSIVIPLNVACALYGFSKYGSMTKEFILLSSPSQDAFFWSACILAVLSIYFTYPIQFNVGFMVVWTHIEPKLNKKAQKPVECVLRIVLVLITMGFASIDLDNYIYYIILHGAFFLVFLGVIMPIFLQICVSCGKEENKARIICFSIFLVFSCIFAISLIAFAFHVYIKEQNRPLE